MTPEPKHLKFATRSIFFLFNFSWLAPETREFTLINLVLN